MDTTQPRPPSQGCKLKFAKAYARHGYRVFPVHWLYEDGKCSCRKPDCTSEGKHPIEVGWQTSASTVDGKLAWWWDRNPEANIGVLCGALANLTILDVDGILGRDTLHDLQEKHGPLPETPIVITGSGGLHYYFQFVPEIDNAVRFAPGLDIRTEGGFVVGVGSKTRDEYRWEASAQLGDLKPARMPDWLVQIIKAAGRPGKNGKGKKLPDKIFEHEGRNNELHRQGRGLRAKNYPQSAIRAALLEANRTVCKPPLTPGEIDALVEQVLTQPDRADFHKNGDAKAKPSEPRTADDFSILASAVVTEPVRWIIPGYVARGHYQELIGDPEVVKTTTALDLCARITTGTDFCGIKICPPSNVAYASNEDSEKHTLVPRLIEANADLSRVRLFSRAFKSIDEDGKEELASLTFPDHLPMIEEQIVADGTVLLVIDPLEAYLTGGTNTHNNASTRKVLAMLDAMAERTGCAILSIRHLNKMSSETKAMYRGGGSIAFAGQARISLMIGPDPTEHGVLDSDPQRRHVFATVKNNLWPREPSRAFRKVVDPETINADSPKGIVHIEWLEGIVAVTADDLVRPQHKPKKSEATAEAEDFLRDELRGGDAKLTEDIEEKAKALKISHSALKRARKKLKIIAGRVKGSFGGPCTMRMPVNNEGEPIVDDEENPNPSEDTEI